MGKVTTLSEEGGTLLGRYSLEGLIGRGGMGEVFRATDERTGRPVAIKTLSLEESPGTSSESQLRRTQVQRFKREYRVASRLEHPSCVRSHLLASVADELLFVMDFCGGPSLRSFTRARVLGIPDALELGLQLLAGLDYLHSRNIVHRDLKPANLLLDASWKPGAGQPVPRLRITDFGIAKIGDLSDERQIGQILGTNAYLAPECLQGAPSDPRVDLYAFGIILFELLTGVHPLAPTSRQLEGSEWVDAQLHALPTSAKSLVPEIPEALDVLLLDLLEKDPTRRPRTAALVHDAILQIAGRDPSSTPPLEGSPYLAAPRFVGRRSELDAARDFLQAAFSPGATAAPARALLVEGEAGAGKSRFLEELLNSDRRARTLVGQCRPEDGHLFECINGLIEVLVPMHLARPSSAAEQRSPAPSTANDEERTQAIPTPAAPAPEVTVDLPKTATGLLQKAYSSRQGYEQLKGSLADAFLELTRRRPVLVLIEDAQWIDLESLDLLAYLMKRVRDEERERGQWLPVAFVISARIADDENRTRTVEQKVADSVESLRRIELSGFGTEQATELIRHMLMLPPGPEVEALAHQLVDGRACSPLLLIQILLLLQLGGELTRGQIDPRGRWSGQWSLPLEPGALARVPLTLQDAIGSRAARLSVETHALLEAAAVFGTRLELRLLHAVLGLHRNQVRDLVDEAAEAGFLLFEGDDGTGSGADGEQILETTEDDPNVRDVLELRFTYDRYREVIYASLPEERRQALHARTARAIEKTYGGDRDWAAELARHYLLGGAPELAWGQALIAARHARQSGAVFQAADAMALALRAAGQARIEVPPVEHEFYADLCVQTGRFETASESYDVCLALSPPRADALRLLGKKSECNMRKGDFARAAQPLESLLASVGDPIPLSRLRYGVQLGWNLLRTLAIALVPALRRTEPATGARAELDGVAARAWQKLGEVYAYMSPLKSLYALARGVILSARLGPGPVTASCYGVAGYAFATAGMSRLARPYIQLAREWAPLQPAQDRAFALAICVGESVLSGRVASELETVHQTVDAALGARDISRGSFGLVFAEAALRAAGHFEPARALAHAVRRMGELTGHDQLSSYGPMFAAFSDLAVGHDATDYAGVFTRAAESAARRGDVLMELVARIHTPLALARSDRAYVPGVDALLELGERWLRGRYVTTSAGTVSALVAGLAFGVIRSSADPLTVRRVLRFSARAGRVCAAQAHEGPLFHGAMAAIQAWCARPQQAERSLQRCASAMAQTRFVGARDLVESLLAEAGPGWQERAQRELPAARIPESIAAPLQQRITQQLEGLKI